MASELQPAARSSQSLSVSLTSSSSRFVYDDDDFRIPPLTQTLQRKPLKPLPEETPRCRPYKKPRPSTGKENVDYESVGHDLFSLGTQSCADLETQFCGLEELDSQSSRLGCIPSSIDCNVEDSSLRDNDVELCYAECQEKEKDGGLRVDKEMYKSNSIEGRLLGRKISLGLYAESDKEDDSFTDEDNGFEALLKLCSEGDLSEERMVLCPLCHVDISDLNDEQRQVHTNECLDKAENQAQEDISPRGSDEPPFCITESILDPVQSHQQANDASSPVIQWLRSLGLAKYEEAFAREEIDWDALQWLTDEDLLSIGITALGPRKKILNALNELRKSHIPVPEALPTLRPASSRITERHTERSTASVSDPRKPAGNKLITQFFPGMVTDTKKVDSVNKPHSEPENNASNSGGRRAQRRNVRNGKLKAIPEWCCIPGTAFRVDAFKFLRSDCCHWFLTHFHLDHYQGLTKSFCHGKIYCSSVTAKLVNMKIGISWDKLQVLPLNEKVNIAGVKVTFFDANHCPGSIMILFELPNGKAVLHTGDFRYNEDMAGPLSTYNINTLILDTTYCNPQYDFPKQEAVIQFVIEAIQAEEFNPKTLFLIGSYTIGKERLFLEVARVLRKKIYINASKLRLLECLGLSKEDLQWFTVNEQESHIHVVPMWTIASFKRLKHLANQYARRFSLIVAFSPTGWTFGKGRKKSPGRRSQQGTIIRYEVPYSEHSSFTELQEFVKLLHPGKIIPSVNNDGPESAASMVSLLHSV